MRECSDILKVMTIDWEGACAGDPRFDLVRFAYDLDGHDQPVWDVVEATGIEPRVLRAYVAHHALRCTTWQIHHHTDDVPRQLDRAERVLERYEAKETAAVAERAGARDHLGHVTRVADASRWRSGPSPANRPSA